jgi:hypothetical protein
MCVYIALKTKKERTAIGYKIIINKRISTIEK